MRRDPKRIAAYLELCRIGDRYRDAFLKRRGLRLSPDHERSIALERMELELLMHRWQGEWRAALKCWNRALALCGFRPYALFKGMALALALFSPREYLDAQDAYARWGSLARWRKLILP